MDDNTISLDLLVEHLATEKWLRGHADMFPKNLYQKVGSGEFVEFIIQDEIIRMLRRDLASIANQLTVIADKWKIVE